MPGTRSGRHRPRSTRHRLLPRRQLLAPLRWLRLRVPATAMAVFLLSLAVALVLGYELFLQDGRRDIDVVLAREHARFDVAIAELLDEELLSAAHPDPVDALEEAVRRYLQLNPSNDSYWTIVTFLRDDRRLAAANGPPSLEPLYASRRLPAGTLNQRETVSSPVGDIRTSSAPVRLDGVDVAVVQIVAPLDPVRIDALEATRLLAAAAGATLLLGGILLATSLWRSLSPLTVLARTARSTELRSLDARVDEPETEDEVGLLAREFNTMLDRLDTARAAQETFMASIGHELRTPITIARGHLELLGTTSTPDPDRVAETVGIVAEELDRMGRLVEDLMAIARADMDDLVQPRPVDLVQWFEDLELRLAGVRGPAHLRILPPPAVTLLADPDRLAQAVLNLVVNAQTHTPAGTRVEVRASQAAETVRITVQDAGQGIPEELQATVFEPFVHGGRAGSTGLGLAVVRAVADAHGGQLELTSSPAGTRVDLVLPFIAAAAADPAKGVATSLGSRPNPDPTVNTAATRRSHVPADPGGR